MHDTTYAAMGNHHFSTKYFIVRPTKIIKEGTLLNAVYFLALQRSLEILVDLRVTWYSEKKNDDFLYMHTWFHAQLTQKILNDI